MPRDSQGAYTLPSTTLVNAGDTIQPNQHNPFAQDAAAALSGSLSRDGLGGMRADLPMGGFRITGMAAGTASSDGATVGQISGQGLPIGSVVDFAGPTAPSLFLLCFGQAISRTDYSDLFAVIGTVYGIGDGVSTFNLPDLRGRVTAGKDDMGGTSAARLDNIPSTTLSGAGGSKAHVLTVPELAAHNHTITDPGHQHGYGVPLSGGGGIASGSGFSGQSGTTASATTGVTLADAGGNTAHNNVQPTIIMNKIIKARAS